MTGAIGEDEVALELDAPGIHPDTAPTVALLRAAAAYFDLLQRDSEIAKQPVTLTGVRIVDKCAMVAARASDILAAKGAVERSNRYIAGDKPPHGLKETVTHAQKGLVSLDPTFSVVSHVGAEWSSSVDVLRDEPDPPPAGTLALRAKLLRIGGRNPAARFEAYAEEEAFSLDATTEIATSLAHHLYDEVDIVAYVQRDARGVITGGRLLEFQALDTSQDAYEAWKQWFQKTGLSEWDEVEDIEGELRGD